MIIRDGLVIGRFFYFVVLVQQSCALLFVFEGHVLWEKCDLDVFVLAEGALDCGFGTECQMCLEHVER